MQSEKWARKIEAKSIWLFEFLFGEKLEINNKQIVFAC